jgi:hypothetical protein
LRRRSLKLHLFPQRTRPTTFHAQLRPREIR